MKKILIIDDDIKLIELLSEYLGGNQFEISYLLDGETALDEIRTHFPDLIILDYMMPGKDGLEVLRDIRRNHDLPVIMLTAKGDDTDRVVGLELGADDYLTKDISQAHMQARIYALLRRVEAQRQPVQEEHILERGDLVLNLERMSVCLKEQPVELTVTEFWIIHCLTLHPGHVKNRQQLMDAASVVLDDNTITSHIKRVRKKFCAIDPDFDRIETAYGMGYRWKAH